MTWLSCRVWQGELWVVAQLTCGLWGGYSKLCGLRVGLGSDSGVGWGVAKVWGGGTA